MPEMSGKTVSPKLGSPIPERRVGHNTPVGTKGWIGESAETEETQRYVGLSRSAALEAAEAIGVTSIRVIEGSQHLTADYQPSRLNLLVVYGVVARAAFF